MRKFLKRFALLVVSRALPVPLNLTLDLHYEAVEKSIDFVKAVPNSFKSPTVWSEDLQAHKSKKTQSSGALSHHDQLSLPRLPIYNIIISPAPGSPRRKHLRGLYKSPTEILGIIDWEPTELAPLYHQARQPQASGLRCPPTSRPRKA
ncbi:hypothetical protein ACJ72_04024 [Emergomyces africanus]|uniref:Uncharacterized protein n=1 Tax=Emergomyces africanus TaxID=1955775 RepID=A0A1B7NXY8_9EURO|nr:hypothetical protein ACJ72_04024 [Emergomyces africanus]